jgi:hypothetical protein
MATGSIALTPGAATLPDNSANNAAPGILRVKSSAATPSPWFLQLLFDATAEEWCTWTFPMPDDYASGAIARVQYKMTSATTGGVAWDVRIAAVSDNDAVDVDAKAFAAANVATAAAVPATAGYLDVVSVTLTNADSLAAGDFVVLRLARAVANAADTATGDAEFLGLNLSYITT